MGKKYYLILFIEYKIIINKIFFIEYAILFPNVQSECLIFVTVNNSLFLVNLVLYLNHHF